LQEEVAIRSQIKFEVNPENMVSMKVQNLSVFDDPVFDAKKQFFVRVIDAIAREGIIPITLTKSPKCKHFESKDEGGFA
jgi:hypothetical protein